MLNMLAIMIQTAESAPTLPAYSENASIWNHMSSALHLSLYRVLSLLIAVLPGILALFVALAVFAILGMAISALLRWFLALIKFDDRFAGAGAGSDWTPTSSPTALAGRIVFWACVVLGALIGVSAFDTSYLAGGAALPIPLLPYLTHAVGAIVLLILGVIIARFLARSVLIGAVNAQLQYARFLSLGVKWLVLVLTAAMILEHLEIGGAIVDIAFSILFGGIVLTLALAVGLGSRELVSRSLESHVERTAERTPTQQVDKASPPAETIRHF